MKEDNKQKKAEDLPPIYEELVERICAEEKEIYHNDLKTFETYVEQAKAEVRDAEKAYLRRLERAVKLLEKKFEEAPKGLMYIKI